MAKVMEFRWLQKKPQDFHYPYRGDFKYVTVPGERFLQFRAEGGEWQTVHGEIPVYWEEFNPTLRLAASS